MLKGGARQKSLKTTVLIREDNVPRMCWPLGLITELFPGRDGIVRCVNVQTAEGVFCRPVQKLHNLEIYYDVNNVKENSQVPDETSREISSVLSGEDVEGNNDETENLAQINLPQVKMTKSGCVVKP